MKQSLNINAKKMFSLILVLLLIIIMFPIVYTDQILTPQSGQTSFSLENEKMKLSFEAYDNKIDLSSITKKDTGYIFDMPNSINWLIRLVDLSTSNYNQITKRQEELNCQTSYTIQNDSGSSKLLTMTWANCAVNATNNFNLTINVLLSANKDYSDWKINVNSNMNDYSIVYTKLFFGINKNPDDFVVINNEQIKNPASNLNQTQNPYSDSGGMAPGVPMVAYWTSNNQMLYFLSKDVRSYQITSNEATGQKYIFGWGIYPTNLGAPDNDLIMPSVLSVGVATGNWYEAAIVLRNWFLTQPDAPPKLYNNQQVPLYWKELSLAETRHIANSDLNYEVQIWDQVKNFYNASNFEVFYWFATNSINMSLASWTQQIVSGLKAQGIHVGFYNNPQSIATSSQLYPQLSQYVCKDQAGNPRLFGSPPNQFAILNYANTQYQNWYANKVKNVANLFDTLFFEIPVPNLCYDSNYPAGVADPWLAMKAFMSKVRSEARDVNPVFALMYEFSYPVFYSVSDTAFSPSTFMPDICSQSINNCNEHVTFVPFLQVFIHDRLPIFGHGLFMVNSFGSYNFDLLDLQSAMAFSYGERIYTKNIWIDNLEVANHQINQVTGQNLQQTANITTDHVNFLKKIVAAQKYSKDFSFYGEMLRPVPSTIQNELVTIDGLLLESLNTHVPLKRYLPAVPNSVYRSPDGSRIGLLFANPKSTSASFSFSFPLTRYGLQDGTYGLYTVNESGKFLTHVFIGSLNEYDVQMLPKSVLVYEIYEYTPPPQNLGNISTSNASPQVSQSPSVSSSGQTTEPGSSVPKQPQIQQRNKQLSSEDDAKKESKSPRLAAKGDYTIELILLVSLFISCLVLFIIYIKREKTS